MRPGSPSLLNHAGVPMSRVFEHVRHLDAFFRPEVMRKPSSAGLSATPPPASMSASARSAARIASVWLRTSDHIVGLILKAEGAVGKRRG